MILWHTISYKRKMDNTLHIIPHTHWDREWYMSFEQHRYRLVELIDKLIDVMEQNCEFKYFHLDGQYIVIEDYLKIKPYMKNRLLSIIEADRIQIGPWYVLQDEYLTSGEANIRNLMYGLKFCKEFGAQPVMTGYFPDSFGNISQAPQILNGFSIDNAVFGRGLNSLGTNNTIISQNGMNQSEIIWRSPDGSEVFAVMFVNWYHNAMELPTIRTLAKEKTSQIINSTLAYASTPHLLGMNGCDHQPVQENLVDAIEIMKEYSQNTQVVISNFKDYLKEIRAYKDNFKTIEGEIAGQFTNGYQLLIDTASSRMYLKQSNFIAQNTIERQTEPLNALSFLFGDSYKTDFILYAWKILMKNHAHDSICGCSVDEVHQEMVTRFNKSLQISKTVAEKSMKYLTDIIDTSTFSNENIVVFNKQPYNITELITTNVDFETTDNISNIIITDENGNYIKSKIKNLGKVFDYELPDNSFRQIKYVNRFEVTFLAENVPSLGFSVYNVEIKTPEDSELLIDYGKNFAENEFIRVVIEKNGSLSITNKKNKKEYRNFNVFEDTGDIGNEYNYTISEECIPITTITNNAIIEIFNSSSFSVTFKIENIMNIPTCCINNKQSNSKIKHKIISFVTLSAKSNRVDIKTIIQNQSNDHRLRALFSPQIKTKYVYADSQFDLVKRNIVPWKGWQNPSNTQRHQSFFELAGDDEGVIIASRGLHEYEIMKNDNTMALTLLRCVGQMGDWGIFPTPEAQCHGQRQAEYSIIIYSKDDRDKAHKAAYSFSDFSLIASQTGKHTGKLKANTSFIKINADFVRMSCLKKSENRDSLIFRIYNTDENDQNISIEFSPIFKKVFQTNLAEEPLNEIILYNGKIELLIPKKKIITLELIK